MEEKEVIYPIKINKVLWDKFKDKVPRTESLNDSVVRLIEKEVQDEFTDNN